MSVQEKIFRDFRVLCIYGGGRKTPLTPIVTVKIAKETAETNRRDTRLLSTFFTTYLPKSNCGLTSPVLVAIKQKFRKNPIHKGTVGGTQKFFTLHPNTTQKLCVLQEHAKRTR